MYWNLKSEIFRDRKQSKRGFSLVEALGSLIIMSMIVGATVKMYSTGAKNQRDDRSYTQAQTDLRTALLHITRTVRHSIGVQMSSAQTNFASAPNSSSTQIIVAVPQPGNAGTDYVRIYRDATTGNIYAQRQDAVGAGSKILDGPSSMTINYFQTTINSTGPSTAASDGAPDSATEVQINLGVTRGNKTTTVTYGSVTSSSVAYITMRNTILSL